MSKPGRTVESVRRANLGGILQIVHRDGPQSRALLTERTGLNRSTIADLVGTLCALGLVEERSPDPSHRVGRPSPVVAPSASVAAIAANPEVDAVEIAAVGLDQSVLAVERFPQDGLISPAETAALIAATIHRWTDGVLADVTLTGVGVAVPGLVRTADGTVRNAPHLEWRDAPLRELVAGATNLPVAVGNDATLGAIAEHLFGAARGIDHVVYLNGGASGIGGGLIVNGAPVLGAGGFAGEFGQNRPGIADAADRRADGGVLEDEVRRSRLLAATGLEAADDRALAEALTTDAAEVRSEVTRQRRILATALTNAVNVLNPSVVVLGGFLAGLAAVDLAGLEADVRAQAMPGTGDDVRILPAELAEHRLLIGAAEAAFAPLIADPASADSSPPVSAAAD